MKPVTTVQRRDVLLVEHDDSMRAATERPLGVTRLPHNACVSAEALLADEVAAEAACVVALLEAVPAVARSTASPPRRVSEAARGTLSPHSC